jgi:putative two-component system response regulator
MRILIVDDDDFALSVLSATLARMGHAVQSAHDGREAMEVLRRGEIRLVITDWDMPGMNGVELIRTIRRDDMSGYIYLIMLTGREGAKQRMEGLCAGADDFLNKPLDPEELLVCLKTAERILSLETRDLALFAMAKLAESRDPETGAHVERVQSYSRLIAQCLSAEVKACNGVDDEFIRLLYQTSPLHDLGKVAIPDSILLKPGRLTSDEFAIMKTHTVLGTQTLDAALQRFPNARFLQMARDIAATHHEKFNGTGYPRGLVGEQIPLCGRIVAVADVYDALTSVRVYKSAMTHEQSRAILLRDRGSHFDPEVVDAFLRAEPRILAVRERLVDAEPKPPAPFVPPICTTAPVLNTPGSCHILVVEDDEVLLAKLVEILTATGEPVMSASNGAQAIKIWEEYHPRVVISDWVMPQVDGVELCRYIRARTEGAATHFIMLTVHSDKSRLLDAYRAGVDDFVPKPFDAEELLARVRAGIRVGKLQAEMHQKHAGSQALNAELAAMNSRLERLSITDELTGIFNRRHAMFRLQEQWSLAERYGQPLTVAMLDIDHFKHTNDTYGHDAGDTVLKGVVGILREQTRGTDAICRVGGEEFLIIFPFQTSDEACVCAERCRSAIERHTFFHDDAQIRVTISVGIASREPIWAEFTDVLKAADQALYAAKHAGRNLVRVAGQTASLAAPIDLAPRADASTPAGKIPPIDLEAVLRRCGGDPHFAAAVMEKFRNQSRGEVEKIAAALAAGDANTVGRIAHSLKSMAAYVAAQSAAELASKIEDLGRSGKLAEIEPLLVRLRQDIEESTTWLSQNSTDRRPKVA